MLPWKQGLCALALRRPQRRDVRAKRPRAQEAPRVAPKARTARDRRRPRPHVPERHSVARKAQTPPPPRPDANVRARCPRSWPAFLIRVVVVWFVRRWLACGRVFVVGGLGGRFRGALGRSAVWRRSELFLCCRGEGRGGGPRYAAAGDNRSQAIRNSRWKGCAAFMAILTRRTATRTQAPILSGFRRRLPHAATASSV